MVRKFDGCSNTAMSKEKKSLKSFAAAASKSIWMADVDHVEEASCTLSANASRPRAFASCTSLMASSELPKLPTWEMKARLAFDEQMKTHPTNQIVSKHSLEVCVGPANQTC